MGGSWRRPALVAGIVLLAMLVPASASVLRSNGVLERTAGSAGRATAGGDVSTTSPGKPMGGVAGTGKVPKPHAVAQPHELHLTKAHGAVFDVRELKSVVVKQERPERTAFGERDSASASPAAPQAGLPATVTKSAIAAATAAAPAPDASFDGLDFATWGAGHPPDENGDVGPNDFIETVNTSIGIYDKGSGNRVAAFTFNSFMSQGHFGNLCDTDNFGDPVVLYDTYEDRWFITDFAFKLDAAGNVVNPPGAFQCFAVSKTGDPVNGGWNFYSIAAPGALNDYPKFGVWPDGIYMSANMFGYPAGSAYQGHHMWALNKQQMYAGAPSPQVVDFAGDTSDFTVIPANSRLQAGAPPVGSSEYFVSTEQFLNALSIYKFHVDWDKISTSTFTGPFTQLAPNCWPNATPANASTTANAADVLAIRAMAQAQYTNQAGAESLWVDHTVQRNVSATNTTCNATIGGNASVRWYQANVTGGTVAATVAQGATFDPEAANTFFRYIPSLAVDRVGDMAVGYTKSNSTTNPQIKYAGRLAGDPLNTLGQSEQTLIDGTGSQSGNCGPSACVRWGDYSGMSLDPNGCEFWMTDEYYATTGLNDQTRIGSFHYPNCTTVGNGTLSGTVTDGTSAIAGVTVTLGNRTATTDGSGNYSFAVPAGTYASESAAKPGYTAASAATLVVPDGGTLTQNFTLGTAAQSGCITDNTQNAFQRGVPSANCDLTSSPGNVTLSNAPTVDQQNTAGTGTGTGTITSTSWAAQTFTEGVTGQLTKVDFTLFCNGCTSNPNLTVSIRATASGLPTGADLASTSIAGNTSGASTTFTAAFASPPTLTAGTQYALIVRTVSSPGTGGYFWIRSSPSTYAGGSRVASADSGSTWTADSTRDYNFHTYVSAGFAPSATLVSSLKDSNPLTGSTPQWTTLSWSATTPAGTAVKFQLAGSNSQYGPFGFVGPDGTAATFFTSSGTDISQFDGFRYVKYEAFLSTSSSSVTPSLSSVTVCFTDKAATAATTLTPSPASGAFGGTAALSATLTSGGNPVPNETVSFTLNGNPAGTALTDASGVASVASASLAGINAGSYPTGVGASFAGDSSFDPSSGSAALTVNPADQAILIGTHAPASAVFNTGFSVAATGGNSGNPVTFSSAGSCSNTGPNFTMTSGTGSCTVEYDQAGNANYNPAPQVTETVNAQKADQTITVVTHAPPSAVFDTGFSVAANGGASGNPVTFSSAGACTNSGPSFTMTSGTGTCSVKFDETGDSNYADASQVVETVNAVKADQTITVDTPAPASAVFGTSFGVAAHAPGGAVTFTSSGGCSNSGNTVTMTSGTGSCSVMFDQAGDSNYNAAPQVAELVNAQKAGQTIAFGTLPSKTYGDPDFALGATASSTLPVGYSASGNCTTAAGNVHITGAGSCQITASQGGNSNYNPAPSVPQSFSIAQKTLTITANDRTKLVGTTLNLGTTAFTTSGLVGGDGISSVSLASAGAAVGAATGTYPIVASSAVPAGGTNLGNYDLHYANGRLTVVAGGLIGTSSVQIGQSNALIDSFDSSLGPYGGSNVGDAASIASNGSITINGAKVHGSVTSTNDSVLLKQFSLVTGNVTAGTAVTNKGTINGTITQHSPGAPITLAPVAVCSPFSPATGISGAFTYSAAKGDLNVSAGGTATLANGSYCFHSVTLSTGSTLQVNGAVSITVTRALDGKSGSIVNTTSVPSNLQISSSFNGTDGIVLGGGSSTYLRVYAPSTDISVTGGAIFGSLLGNTLKSANDTAIHVDVH